MRLNIFLNIYWLFVFKILSSFSLPVWYFNISFLTTAVLIVQLFQVEGRVRNSISTLVFNAICRIFALSHLSNFSSHY